MKILPPTGMREWMCIASGSLALLSLVNSMVRLWQGEWLSALSNLIICLTNLIILITWFVRM